MAAGGRGFHAVQRLTIRRVGFAPEAVRDAGRRHQVTFVARVDEDAARVARAAQRGDGGDACAVFLDAVGAVQPFVAAYVERVVGDEGFEDLFGDVRLEHPHAVGVGVVVAVLRFGLLLPARVVVVGFLDAGVKVTAQSANHRIVAGVGPAQALRGESAQVLLGADQNHALLQLFGLHGRDHAG